MIAKNTVLALLEKGLTLSTAESLTAGMVSSAICDVPGASGCFLGGVCAYQDEVKEKWLNVPEAVIQKHSAVSAPCARAMALGAKEKFASDFALSTTGYAGPAGENVGLVYVGIAHPRGVHVHRLQLSGSRQGIRKMTVQIALHILQKEIKNMAKKAASDKKDMKNLDATQQEKLRALEMTLSSIEKEFGKGTVMKLGDKTAMQVETVPTGCLDLDMALGVGGIPRGRIVEVFGPESSGKTTVALHVVAEVQKLGGAAAFIDAEHALDPAYAKNLGVNIDELYVSQPNCGEDALEIAEALLRSGAIDIVVIDSVAALVPRAEIDGEMGDSFVGIQARLMSQAMRKLTGVVAKTNAIALFINQIREKVGVMYGNPETTPGGRALKFYASVRLDVRKGEQLKNGSEVVGNRTKVKVVKNKVAPPFRTCEFDLIFGQGISKEGSLLDLAVEKDIIQKSGAWFSYNDQRIGQGRDNTRQFLKEHPDVFNEIEQKLRAVLNTSAVPAVDENDIPEMDPDMEDNDEA